MSDTEYLLFNGILVYSQHKQQLASTVLSVAGKYAYPYLSPGTVFLKSCCRVTHCRCCVTNDECNLRSGVPIFFRGGKERLIQLLDYSSAAPKLKHLSARMSATPSLDKNEPSTITGNRFVGGNYTRHEQPEFTCLYSTADKNMVYFVKHALLFRTW